MCDERERRVHLKCNNRFLDLTDEQLADGCDRNATENQELKEPDKCIRCMNSQDQKYAATCETCRKCCHLQCTEIGNKDLKYIAENSFQWICPNEKCKPNYWPGKPSDKDETNNRYKLLAKVENKMENKGKKQVKCLKNRIQKNSLWTELPKISSKDYIGKELCNQCSYKINRNCNSVKCKICERWTHVKCSDMSTKEYKDENNKKSKWTCLKCRTGETITNQKFNKYVCSVDQLPDEWEDILRYLGTVDSYSVFLLTSF